jgi:ABC-2 type transport system permease protein
VSTGVGALSVHQLRYEQKSYWRNPAAAGFTFIFPILFLVIFASINKDDTVGFLGGINYNQYYIPGIMCFGVISATFTNLAMTLCIRRDSGILKRLRGTPLPTSAMLGGLLLNAVVVAAILSALVGAIGFLFYSLDFPGHWPALIVSLLIGALAFAALGVAVSTLVPNADAAPAVVNGILFPILFVSGVFFPIESNESWLARIGEFFPVRHFVNAVFTAFDPRQASGPAHGWAWSDLAVVGAWAVVGVVVAVRSFRWEPRTPQP